MHRYLPERPGLRQAREAFLSTAMVNVKKSGGRSTSRLADIAEFARLDASRIRRQIALIQPDIVVGGNLGAEFSGVSHLLHMAFLPGLCGSLCHPCFVNPAM